MKNNTSTNPLQQYFRRIQGYISLPSNGKYYTKKDIEETTIIDEIPIMAMTSKDDINLKNPEGLLNGESVKSLILSCTQGIKNPMHLLSMDIEAIITAIRLYSYGPNMEISSECEKCKHENKYEIDLQSLLDNMTKIDKDFPVTLNNNLTVFIKPLTFECTLKANLAGLEQEKISRKINSLNIEDPEYISAISSGINNLGNLNFEILAMCVDKIIDEDNDINIKNNTKEHKSWIKELLFNISNTEAELINEKISEIPKNYGIKKIHKAICQNENCQTEYEMPISLEPTTFFLPSSVQDKLKKS